MSWSIVVAAGLLEGAWAVGLKYTEGFTRFWPSVFTIVAMVCSLSLLALATKSLPISTSYTVWTGIGLASTVIVGIAFLGEPKTVARIVCVCLVVVGIIGLNLVSSHE